MYNYGSTQYGLVKYAENTPAPEELEKYFVDLTNYVPQFIWQIPEMKAIYDSQGTQLGALLYYTNDILNQGFIDTATWSLNDWEEEYGVDTNLNMSFEDRREVLKAKKRGQGTTTKAMIKNAAEAFSGGEVNVIEDNEHYKFIVQFIGIKGIPRNMQAFKDMLETIKPAHLAYDFSFTYNTYGDIRDNSFSYERLQNYSHGDIRTTPDIKKGMKWNETNK